MGQGYLLIERLVHFHFVWQYRLLSISGDTPVGLFLKEQANGGETVGTGLDGDSILAGYVWSARGLLRFPVSCSWFACFSDKRILSVL